jgi:hypothetical protein
VQAAVSHAVERRLNRTRVLRDATALSSRVGKVEGSTCFTVFNLSDLFFFKKRMKTELYHSE